ncbi:MAG: 2-dehydro-3-deoxyphosphogluconate aldolase / (4S)-4-hydroxy-2-oxoglutarate aldolase [Actinomycetota bacterium]|nr:2-dehydro-3-deoxyphosphogluconate aldolase / (4S)-4-hydroxy-2-oxoglutarate aldolase [Actinomycetota bacterium]
MTTVLADVVRDKLAALRVIPIVVIDDPSQALPLADALAQGGLPCAEVTLRTSAGFETIAAMAARGDILVGAGTVTTVEQVDRAVDSGAVFLVCPGLSVDVVRRARDRGVLILPGVATASELQSAIGEGLESVKLFPAEVLGGVKLLDALSGPFPSVRFMPSGGITIENALSYLDHASTFAVGASWITPRALLRSGDFDSIWALAAQAASTLGSGSRS